MVDPDKGAHMDIFQRTEKVGNSHQVSRHIFVWSDVQ